MVYAKLFHNCRGLLPPQGGDDYGGDRDSKAEQRGGPQSVSSFHALDDQYMQQSTGLLTLAMIIMMALHYTLVEINRFIELEGLL